MTGDIRDTLTAEHHVHVMWIPRFGRKVFQVSLLVSRMSERAQTKLSLTSRPSRFRSIFVSLWRSRFDLSISVNL